MAHVWYLYQQVQDKRDFFCSFLLSADKSILTDTLISFFFFFTRYSIVNLKKVAPKTIWFELRFCGTQQPWPAMFSPGNRIQRSMRKGIDITLFLPSSHSKGFPVTSLHFTEYDIKKSAFTLKHSSIFYLIFVTLKWALRQNENELILQNITSSIFPVRTLDSSLCGAIQFESMNLTDLTEFNQFEIARNCIVCSFRFISNIYVYCHFIFLILSVRGLPVDVKIWHL